jgi:hypothetical protein
VPESDLALFGPFSDAAIAKAKELSIAPDKRADLEARQRDDERQWAQLAETMRQNADTRAYRQQQVGVARGQLDLARQREQRIATTPNQGRPPTVEQSKTAGFFSRMDGAIRNLDEIEDAIAGMNPVSMAVQGFALTPNLVKSEAYQLFEQAMREFTEARLRKESGAAIPESEFENDRRTYFPQPGDMPATLEKKRQARERVAAAFARQAGGALDEFYGPERAESLRQQYQMGGGGEDVPPAVRDALSGVGDGRHELSDGTVWIKKGSSIRKAGG